MQSDSIIYAIGIHAVLTGNDRLSPPVASSLVRPFMSRHPFAEDILCICLEHDEHVGQHVQYRDLELKVFSARLVAPSPNLGESFSENSMDAPICEPSSF